MKNPDYQIAVPNRPNYLSNKVMIVDGLVGGGKGMISPIVGSIPKVEMWIHRGKIEQICGVHHLDNISSDGAVSLLKSWIDEEFYNISIVRETNLRFKDMSCIFKDARPWRYIARLFQNDGKEAVQRIIDNEFILNVMTHANTGYSEPIFKALEERLIYVRIVRAPMTEYVLNHLARWSQRWGDDIDGMILHHLKNNDSKSNVPFFMYGKEDKYLKSSPMDKAILMLEEWQRGGDEVIDKMKETSSAQIIEVPFEKFVLSPFQYVDSISDAVGVPIDWITRRMMKKQKVPRESISDAPVNRAYIKQGWKAPQIHRSISQEMNEARKVAKKYASTEAMLILDTINEKYIDRYELG